MIRQTGQQSSFEGLEQLLHQIESRGLKSLKSDQLMDLGRLYRRLVSELSSAQALGIDEARTAYLNQLASRAYGHIYVAESKGWPSVSRFFRRDFPRSFRKNLLFMLAAFVIMYGAALFAYAVVHQDPGKAEAVFGPGASEMIDEIASRHTTRRNWMPEETRPMMSSFVMVNNLKVAASAFSVGVLGGILTCAILFHNGLMLGVIAGAVQLRGPQVALGFWAFVAPHGVIELTAIFIAGGAGLMLGWALINPGRYTRKTALKLAGREAFTLVLGVAAMLVVAGIIEGFFSPSMVPEALKLGTAAILGLALYAYLLLAGRDVTVANHRQP
jgi:uncharacterized membrane protein SpoIIM required for sporulation